MKPIYDLLGVTVGILQCGQNDIDKQEAYSRDVVYGTNSEFGFDYLRDNLAESRWRPRPSAATASRSSTRWTTSSSTRRARR